MVLQNRMTSVVHCLQGGICAVLGEDYCFVVNKSGQIQTNIHKLTHYASQLREQATEGQLS
jgi:hypothetical protein